MLLVSNDTVLRVVRLRAQPTNRTTLHRGRCRLGIRRDRRYGTIVCDLERRRIVKLLPSREMATDEAWLTAHFSIPVVSGD